MVARAVQLWLGLSIAAPVAALPPLEAYGQLPSVALITLSPDGAQIALAMEGPRGREIQVRKVADHQLVISINTGTNKVRSLQWAGDHHLLITPSVTGEIIGISGPKRENLQVVDLDLVTRKPVPLLDKISLWSTSHLNIVAKPPQVRIVDGRATAFLTGISFPNRRGVLTLYAIDLDTHRTRQIAVGDEATTGWLVDATGTIAARSEYADDTGRFELWTRSDRGGLIKSLDEKYPLDPPTLAGFGRTPDTVLVMQHSDDDWVYRELRLGTSTLLPATSDLPTGELVNDPKTGLVVGSHRQNGFAVDYHFLSEFDARLWRGVLRGFPAAVVCIADWCDDRKKIVLQVEGKNVGAAYYLLDTGTHRADWLADEYREIAPSDIGETRLISYPAADGLPIPAYVTLPPAQGNATGLPLIVLPHGGPGAHDMAGFDWLAQALASRGYAVLQPQYRGSTGFGEKFQAAGYGEWGRKMQTDLSDGVAYLAAAKTIDPKRVCIVGGSYGGYAALAGVTLQSDIYRCSVSVAGPADLRAMLAVTRPDSGVLRFWERYMGAKSRGDRELDEISPVRFAARAGVPILLIHGADDTVVPITQSKLMAAALTKAGHPPTFVTLPGEDHWLSRTETRTAMLRATVDFLTANLPATVVTTDALARANEGAAQR